MKTEQIEKIEHTVYRGYEEKLRPKNRRNINGLWLVHLRNGTETVPPLSSKNPYLFEAQKLNNMLYTLPELEEGIDTIFPDMSRPLVLDIGCYFGDTVVALGKHNPGVNVLGLDVKYKRVVKSCRKIKRAKVTNGKVAICDVQELLPILPPQSVDVVCVFFSDPYRKTRHKKFRVLNETFFNDITRVLRSHGFVWIKTDHPDYFNEAAKTAIDCNFKILEEMPAGIIENRSYKTLFEDIFIRQNIKVHQLFVTTDV